MEQTHKTNKQTIELALLSRINMEQTHKTNKQTIERALLSRIDMERTSQNEQTNDWARTPI